MPHCCTVGAPPASNAPNEPTCANAAEHVVVSACWSAASLVPLSRPISLSLRPQIADVALKYAAYAVTAAWADLNNPGTGPLTSDTFAIVTVESVMPVE